MSIVATAYVEIRSNGYLLTDKLINSAIDSSTFSWLSIRIASARKLLHIIIEALEHTGALIGKIFKFKTE